MSEISVLVCKYKKCEFEMRALHVQMVKFAVEELGITQQAALKMKMLPFLDGYIAAQGAMQPYRKDEK